jgi:hypothetical protein
MSWSIGFIGKPEKVIEALDAQSAKFNDQSKVEYDEALPHLKALVAQNYGHMYPVKITAAGHGTSGENGNRQLTASIELVYNLVV